MSEIKIVYIDDNIDDVVSKYLKTVYCTENYLENSNEYVKKYVEVIFDENLNYESLLNDTRIRSANVLLIDNKLYESRSAGSGRLTGRQFKILLRRFFPFIETLIITQDETLIGENIVHKFSGTNISKSDAYYTENLGKKIDISIKEVLEYEKLSKELDNNTDVDTLLIEKVRLSLRGDDSYNELSKADVDNLIESFKELKDKIDL